MRQIKIVATLLLFSLSATAQTPKVIREMLAHSSQLVIPTTATYPAAPLGEIAKAPEGFEPFHLSLVGRHGSRYHENLGEIEETYGIYRKADSLGILTAKGKELYAVLDRILCAERGHSGELSTLGYNQWLGIAHRLYNNFTPLFTNGTIESKASMVMRCVMSMMAFNQGIKECNDKISIVQYSRKCEMPILLPLTDNHDMPKVAKDIYYEYRKVGEWVAERKAWAERSNCSSFISKVTTDRNRFLKECGGKTDFHATSSSFAMLNFADNFGEGNRELLHSLFTPEEMYDIYVYTAAVWSNNTIGRGNDVVEMYASYVKPLIDEVMDNAKAAVEGKNMCTANLYFTHDSYLFPTLSIIGYEGCVPQYCTDIERLSTQTKYSLLIPMAANLQFVLYRNKAGEVLVRSLINEGDAYLPIKCKTAPFYPWEDFCKLVDENMGKLLETRKKLLQKYNEGVEK